MKLKNLRELNLFAITERANELMEHVAKLQMTNKEIIKLAKEQVVSNDADTKCDPWESLAWHIVEMEFFERQVREEDLTCESNSKDSLFHGGFGV